MHTCFREFWRKHETTKYIESKGLKRKYISQQKLFFLYRKLEGLFSESNMPLYLCKAFADKDLKTDIEYIPVYVTSLYFVNASLPGLTEKMNKIGIIYHFGCLPESLICYVIEKFS